MIRGGQKVSIWRSWSPWYLRRMIERFQLDVQRHDTESERDWEYWEAVLMGLENPGRFALRFRVEGSTLVIDTTKDAQ